MSKDHKWRTVWPDPGSTNASIHQECDCGAKRGLDTSFPVWFVGPMECPLAEPTITNLLHWPFALTTEEIQAIFALSPRMREYLAITLAMAHRAVEIFKTGGVDKQ